MNPKIIFTKSNRKLILSVPDDSSTSPELQLTPPAEVPWDEADYTALNSPVIFRNLT